VEPEFGEDPVAEAVFGAGAEGENFEEYDDCS
jgi:hypothetical protein